MQRKSFVNRPESQEEWDAARQSFLESFRNPETRRARDHDLRAIFGDAMEAHILSEFAQGSRADVDRRVTELWNQMLERGWKSSTVTRRLATLRLFVKFLYSQGWVRAGEEPEGEHRVRNKRRASDVQRAPEAQNETLAPEVIEKLLQKPDVDTEAGARDAALLCLMALDGLSRLQACMVDARDLDAEHGRLAVLPLRQASSLSARMARLDKAPAEADAPDASHILDLQPRTREALRKYLERSGHKEEEGAPLLCTLHRGRRSGPASKRRLTQDGIYGIVASYAKKIGHPEINSRKLQQSAATRKSK